MSESDKFSRHVHEQCQDHGINPTIESYGPFCKAWLRKDGAKYGFEVSRNELNAKEKVERLSRKLAEAANGE